ncbi:hypothetical protein COCOBI_13-0470 [Coccomyxa sp. Obi]|nr:hypothetical protein COCOBI_13-0470 [Coccomyxa sp. Obi]
MKSSDMCKGFRALFFVLVYLRTSTCSSASFTITPPTGSILGPFDALDVSSGVDTTITQTRPGSPSFSTVAVTMQVGRADVTLIDSLLKGAQLPYVDISFYAAGGNQVGSNQQAYRKISLINAFVISYTSAADPSTGLPITTFTLQSLKRKDSTYPTKLGALSVAQYTYDLLLKRVV